MCTFKVSHSWAISWRSTINIQLYIYVETRYKYYIYIYIIYNILHTLHVHVCLCVCSTFYGYVLQRPSDVDVRFLDLQKVVSGWLHFLWESWTGPLYKSYESTGALIPTKLYLSCRLALDCDPNFIGFLHHSHESRSYNSIPRNNVIFG